MSIYECLCLRASSGRPYMFSVLATSGDQTVMRERTYQAVPRDRATSAKELIFFALIDCIGLAGEGRAIHPALVGLLQPDPQHSASCRIVSVPVL